MKLAINIIRKINRKAIILETIPVADEAEARRLGTAAIVKHMVNMNDPVYWDWAD